MNNILSRPIGRDAISALSFLAGAGICGALVFLFFVRPLQRENEDSWVYSVESDLRLLGALNQGQIENVKRNTELRLALHAKALKGPLRNHPGSQYFLWAIKTYCRTSNIINNKQIISLVSDVPDEKPLPPRIYWEQTPEY